MVNHRIVLNGHGTISGAYLKACALIPNADVVGVVGRNAKRAEDFAQQHGIAVFGTSLADVVTRSSATAVIICTPNALHDEGVLAAAELGLHCLCEKPLHISLDKQREMIEACEKAGVKLAVSYMRRFSEHWQLIKRLIDEGKLGRIIAVDATIKHFRDAAYYDSWHGTYELDGGGPFIQQGSHIIDLVQWLCGGFHEVTDARMFRLVHDIETEDHGYAIVRYSNDAVGMITASTACAGIRRELIEISGTAGSISADFKGIVTWSVPGLEQPNECLEVTGNEGLFARLVEDFLWSIEQDRPPFVDGASAGVTTELVNDIYRKAGLPIVRTME
ncbi:Gfo/Idh/MocA family protein [Paenibacillus sp. FA6]|uniref:Gfo/Idh/MocA family protein n=1 Tax=Paenibacillus sp. FA6 TaxID=3413029 RepID=UPI003F656FEA